MIHIRIVLITTIYLLINSSVNAQTYTCYDCGCGPGEGTYWELDDCLDKCEVSLGCFTGICAPITMPGRKPGYFEELTQAYWFGDNLGCYSVMADRDRSYNCIGWAAGSESLWIWDEVDYFYGDRDGTVEVEDFDAFFAFGGYTPSSSCFQVGGYEKIVLYGKLQSDGTIEPTHAAKQSDFTEGGSDWWESKEGDFKRIIHHINDLTKEYGDIIKCYEKYIGN